MFLSTGRSPEDIEGKGNIMGKKDGKPEPNDVGSNMKIKISKETAKKIQDKKK
ncbi:hypothetical protein [Bacillus sp. SRB1LM]|uniref:hypothetical protein n=1 Tax=Bacillus sp. SRB1LM TaxID=2608688 RepID=UPI0018C3D128|nr:hypothetical protein [Bacillus sp. SRB1LM]